VGTYARLVGLTLDGVVSYRTSLHHDVVLSAQGYAGMASPRDPTYQGMAVPLVLAK
jgi:hypothetical protein